MSTTADPHAPPFLASLFDTLRTVTVALGVALFVRVLLFQPFTIPSESMEPGLLVGDYIVITKFDYGWSRYALPLSPPVFKGELFPRLAKRGDVVVFKKPGDERHEDVIKRVIGLPGDRVQVRDGTVWVNGLPIPRRPTGEGPDPGAPDIKVTRFQEKLDHHAYLTFDRGPGHDGDDTGIYRVPQGHYFVMGDNRDDSADSRWPQGWGMGYVPVENVLGKARLILLSWKPGASPLKPWTWLAIRGDRLLRGLL